MDVTQFPGPTAPDLEQRTSALNAEKSWVVEAPAGSGKTGLLIQRFLKLLALVDDPAEVLALTFTQKATGEMRERVLHALQSAAQGGESPRSAFERLTFDLATAVMERDQLLGWLLLERPHRLNIRTIDSLCSEIARALPLLSGGSASGSPVRDAEPLYRRAAHAVMMRFGEEETALNAAIRTVLLHRDGDLMFCERVLAEMLATREQWGRLIPLGASELDDETLDTRVLPRLNESLERTLCTALTELHRCFPEGDLAEVARIARELATAEGYEAAPSAFSRCALLPGTPGTDASHFDHWLLVAQLLLTNGGTWRKTFPVNLVGAKVEKRIAAQLKLVITGIDSDELAALLHGVRSLPPARYPAEQWVVTKALFRLLQHALVELQLLFAREGVCDFSAVALAARTALAADYGEVQVAMGTRLRHLLVDEMQDTSSSQYELLEALTAGWDGGSQTVFLVGDPKQSIYLFRQARVELFQQCMETSTLGDIPLGVLRLSANFRSGRHIVQQFNEAFAEIFPSDRVMDGDVTYSPAEAVLPESRGEGIAWHMDPLPRADDTPGAIRQRQRALRKEAVAIGRIVAAQRMDQPGKRVAVLTRVRSHVAEIAKEFARRGIPYRAVEIEPLGERREVLDMLAITRALLHPADRTAWLAVLHAPWCGAGLADLFRLAGGDQPGRSKEALRGSLRERLHLLSSPMRSRVEQTLDIMDAALLRSGIESLANRVERTWRSLGGDRCTDAAGQKNVRQFLRMMDEMEQDGERIDNQTLDRRLERLFAEGGSAPDAVDIMTIHKAKGLEWDTVLVPGMHRAGAQGQYSALNWLEMPGRAHDGSRDVLLASLPAKGSEPGNLYTFIYSTRKNRTYAELKRVLYVAATRARTSLHLFAWPESTKEGEAITRAGTLLKAAGRAASVHLQPGAAPEIVFYHSEEPEPLALAAAAEEAAAGNQMTAPVRTPPTVKRLAEGYSPLLQLHRAALPVPFKPAEVRSAAFSRPQGSFGARAVGSTIHAFIERLAGELAEKPRKADQADRVATDLLQELPAWRPAVHATLRAGGLPLDGAGRATETVLRALGNLLGSEEGRWLLAPHAGAASEAPWRSAENSGGMQRVRLDRSFFAGSKPGQPGASTLWIIDFKTSDRAPKEQDAFLAEEREHYSPQLETYAKLRLKLLPPETPVMLALSYPLMGRLVYWAFGASTEPLSPVTGPITDGQMALFG